MLSNAQHGCIRVRELISSTLAASARRLHCSLADGTREAISVSVAEVAVVEQPTALAVAVLIAWK